MSYFPSSVILQTPEHSRIDQIKCTVSYLQPARCYLALLRSQLPNYLANNAWLPGTGVRCILFHRLDCVPVCAVLLDHRSQTKNFYSSFFEVLAG